MNDGTPYIIRLSTLGGTRGPSSNPSFLFASPFRVPEDHQATIKISKFYFKAPNAHLSSPYLIVTYKTAEGTFQKIYDFSMEMRGASFTNSLDTENLKNVFEFLMAIDNRIFMDMGIHLEYTQLNTNDASINHNMKSKFVPDDINAFFEAMRATGGRIFLYFNYEYNQEILAEPLKLNGGLLGMFGKTPYETLEVYPFTPVDIKIKPATRFIRVSCDKVSNAYSNIMEKGGVVNMDACLALIPIRISDQVDGYCYYEENSGNNNVLLNGEYIDSIKFYFQDGETDEYLQNLNNYELELELRIVNLNQPSAAGIMEDVRRMMLEK